MCRRTGAAALLLGVHVLAAAGCETGSDAPAFDVELDMRVTELVGRDSTGFASCSWVASATGIGDPGVVAELRGGVIEFLGVSRQFAPEEAAGFWGGSSTISTGETLTTTGRSDFQGRWTMALEFWWVPEGTRELAVAQNGIICDPTS